MFHVSRPLRTSHTWYAWHTPIRSSHKFELYPTHSQLTVVDSDPEGLPVAVPEATVHVALADAVAEFERGGDGVSEPVTDVAGNCFDDGAKVDMTVEVALSGAETACVGEFDGDAVPVGTENPERCAIEIV
jgi:hypothetical protein